MTRSTGFSYVLAPAFSLALASAPGCFFTSGINSEPQAQIETVEAGPYHRNEPLALTAYKSDDPDSDRLIVDWRAFTCSADRTQCDVPAFATLNDADPSDQFVFTVPARRSNPEIDEPTAIVSVVGTVFDGRGASHEDRLFVDISNRDPEIQFQVQGTEVAPGAAAYPVGSYVQIFAGFSDPDGDPTESTWSYIAPLASDPTQVGWRSLDNDGYELDPDVSGLWTVEITATDAVGGATTVSAPIDMRPDGLPCIGSMEPQAIEGARYIVDQDGVARRFAVLTVRDDLDAYPPRRDKPYFASAHFRWFLSSPDTDDQLVELTQHEEPDYLLDPSLYAPGDRITLRVEIDDRAGREIVCSEQSPTCSLSGDTCMQRQSWDVEIR